MHGTETKLGEAASRGVAKCDGPGASAFDACRSVESCVGLLCNGPTEPRETHSRYRPSSESEQQLPNYGLGTRSDDCDSPSPAAHDTPSKEGKLGVCTEVKADRVSDKGEGSQKWRSLRPSEVVRLLNSTPLGRVIDDRQLYRHRQHAPWIQTDGNRIDLVMYVAWLFAHRAKRRARARRRVHGREIVSLDDLRELLRRQNYRCAMTGVPLTPSNFALDHIVPLAEGGGFTAANSQLVLKVVNRAKNTMSMTEFVEMCRRVARHHHRKKGES